MTTPYTTTRHRCDFCRRSYAAKSAAFQHEARCWCNPATRTCPTCSHYNDDAPADGRCLIGLGVWNYGIDPEDPGCFEIRVSCPGWKAEQ